MFEMGPDVKGSIQFLLGQEAFDYFVLREKGFEIAPFLPDLHCIPLYHIIGLFPRKAFSGQQKKDCFRKD